MVNTAETTAFFENADSMGLRADTRQRLRDEGIDLIDDLVDLDEPMMKAIVEIMRKPGDCVPDPNNPGQDRLRDPYVFGAKTQRRLLEAAEYIRHLKGINRDDDARNLRYPIIKDFTQQYKSLKERKDGEQLKVPRFNKETRILAWSESFDDFLDMAVGVRCAPLSYVTREAAAPAGTTPPTANGVSHLEEQVSVTKDLIAYLTHTHPQF